MMRQQIVFLKSIFREITLKFYEFCRFYEKDSSIKVVKA